MLCSIKDAASYFVFLYYIHVCVCERESLVSMARVLQNSKKCDQVSEEKHEFSGLEAEINTCDGMHCPCFH